MKSSYIYILYISRIIYIILQFAFPPSITEIFFKLLLIFIHLFIGHITWLVDPSSQPRMKPGSMAVKPESSPLEFPALIILNYCILFYCVYDNFFIHSLKIDIYGVSNLSRQVPRDETAGSKAGSIF